MIHEITESISNFIQTVVLGQMVIVTAVAVVTVLMLFYRIFVDSRYKRYLEMYSGQIIDRMMAGMESPNGEFTHGRIDKPMRTDYIKMRALRDALISHIDLVEGSEQKIIIDTYDQLGFRKKDIFDCLSWRWQVRLTAASRLILLQDSRLGSLFQALAADPSPFVQGLAYLAISKLDHPANRPDLLNRIPIRLVEKQNLMMGIAHSLCMKHGVRVMLHLLENDKNLARVEYCLLVLSPQVTSEESPILIQLLTQYGARSPQVTRTLIKTFIRLFDPAGIQAIRPFIDHKDASVRAAAAEYLATISETGLMPDEFDRLAKDENIRVRRSMKSAILKGVA